MAVLRVDYTAFTDNVTALEIFLVHRVFLFYFCYWLIFCLVA